MRFCVRLGSRFAQFMPCILRSAVVQSNRKTGPAGSSLAESRLMHLKTTPAWPLEVRLITRSRAAEYLL